MQGPQAARPVYRHAQLHRLFAPRSVAVVGASANASQFGSRVITKLAECGFEGKVWPVNPRYDEIGGQRCYPTVAALPESPDCVVVTVPREHVEAVVRDCAARGAGGVVIFTSGFAELGTPEREAEQHRLVEVARAGGVRLLGPNCIGLLNYGIGFQATFAIAPYRPPGERAIGLISQSGGLGFALAQAMEHGLSFSHVLTSGNAADVDVADQIAYLAKEPGCHAIACVFEGMAQPRRLLEAAELAAAAGKPLVVYKMAVGSLGAAAALSHTGNLAGSDAAYRAAFRRSGAVMVDGMEALLETTAFLAKAGRPRATGAAVLATSGGACVMFADKAEAHGVPLPQPGPQSAPTLERVVPAFGNPGNPCDVTGQVQASPAAFYECIDAMVGDPAYATVVIPQPHASQATRERIGPLREAARRHDKVVCSVWLSEWLEGPGALETELEPRVALFRSVDRCFAAIAAWLERERLRSLPRASARLSDSGAAPAAGRALAAARGRVIGEREAKALLAGYGVPVAPDVLVQDADAAVTAAAGVGYPVVLKVESPDLPHKTEAGVIRLNLRDEPQVRAAFADVMANARRATQRIEGVLVQPLAASGVEVMVGGRIDPLFGPLVVVGAGGVLVELLRDAVTDLAPVSPAQARDMLERLRCRRLFDGFRGGSAVDLDALAAVVARISEFIADQAQAIEEVDVNPLICPGGDRIVAVDALVVRRGG